MEFWPKILGITLQFQVPFMRTCIRVTPKHQNISNEIAMRFTMEGLDKLRKRR